MNIEAELKKDGIEIIGRLDTLSVNSISRNAAEKICTDGPVPVASLMSDL